MPVTVKKVGDRYQVSTPNGIKAKGTTKEKADAQRRLLYAIEENPNFVQRKKAAGRSK